MSQLAVIIVNYNAGPMLRECLTALEAQTVRPDRVLVVDNGSRDDSLDRCEPIFPWVEFHRQGQNLGFARGNNVGVELAADCEWVALLNPDAFPAPRWVEAFLAAADRFPDTAAFASCMLSATHEGVVDGAGDAYRVDGLAWNRLQGEAVSRLPAEPHEVFSPSAGAGFYRRHVFVEAGGFAERFFCYYEDVDLGFRLRLLGYRCRYLPDAVVRHVGSAVSGKGSDFSIYHVHRNVVWNYVRNMPSPYVWIHLPAHVAANLVSIGIFVAKGRGRTILRAKWDALKGLPATWRERREVQRRRRVPGEEVVRHMQRGNALGTIFRRAIRSMRGPDARGDAARAARAGEAHGTGVRAASGDDRRETAAEGTVWR